MTTRGGKRPGAGRKPGSGLATKSSAIAKSEVESGRVLPKEDHMNKELVKRAEAERSEQELPDSGPAA